MIALIVFISVCAGATGATTVDPNAKYLTSADVTRVTGIPGVKLVPRDPSKGAGGDLNFARADGDLILMVLFSDDAIYRKSKAMKNYVKETVKGLGDDAFLGPSTGPVYILYFLKGQKSVSLSTYFDMKADMKPILSQEKLVALAKLILSRL